jgi:hypothetical protein
MKVSHALLCVENVSGSSPSPQKHSERSDSIDDNADFGVRMYGLTSAIDTGIIFEREKN